jgi:hypothetical protein
MRMLHSCGLGRDCAAASNSAQSRNLRHAVTPSASELAAKHCLKRIAAAKSRGKGPLQPSGDVTRHLLLTSGAKEVIVPDPATGPIACLNRRPPPKNQRSSTDLLSRSPPKPFRIREGSTPAERRPRHRRAGPLATNGSRVSLRGL